VVSDGVTREQFIELVRAQPRGVVATVGPDGAPQAALVDFAVTDDGHLVFDSASDARKIDNIRADARVAVVVGCEGQACVQVEGVADIATGAARVEFGRVYEARFPGARALADGFSVIRVRPHRLRLYDAALDPPSVVEGVPGWLRALT